MAIINGRIPTVLLQLVGKNSVGKKMFVSRGKMTRGLNLARRMLKIYIGILVPLADAYRTYSEQVEAKAYWTRAGQPQKAATPGTSNHGMAKAVDFGSPLNFSNTRGHEIARWLFPLLGFSWAQGRAYGEPWHWVWVGFPPRPTLRFGSRGNVVKLWQLYLRLWQYAVGKRGKQLIWPDGDFGSKTRSDTIAWQKKMRLTADGVVGKKSWAKARLS